MLDRAYHGLVDEASSLELNGAIGIGWGGPSVFGHRPSLLCGINLNQLVVLLCGLVCEGTREDGHMLCYYLTTGASTWDTSQGTRQVNMI